MSAKSEPPRTGPISILPATEGIDEEWGAEDDVHPKIDVPASPKLPPNARVLEPPKEPAAAKARAFPKSPAVTPKEESVRAASHTVSPSKAPSASLPASRRTGTGAYVAVLAVLAGAGIWFAVRSPQPEPVSTPVAIEAPPAASSAAVAPPTKPVPVPSPSTTPLAASADPGAAPVAEPTPSSSAPAAPPSAPGGETIAIKINITPEGSKLVLKGEEFGRSPMTLELPRGERRVFEVVAKGYVPRRLIVDGTKPEIAFGLKPVEP